MDHVISFRVDKDTVALMDRVTQTTGESRSRFVARALRQYVEQEADFLNFIQEGIDAADRGEVVSQDEMERWVEKRIAARTPPIAAE